MRSLGYTETITLTITVTYNEYNSNISFYYHLVRCQKEMSSADPFKYKIYFQATRQDFVSINIINVHQVDLNALTVQRRINHLTKSFI